MLNRVEIIGNLGKDPEVTYLDSGVAVAKFRVAVTESYKDKKGEKQSTTEWFRVELWRGIAEVAEKCLHKGGFRIRTDTAIPKAQNCNSLRNTAMAQIPTTREPNRRLTTKQITMAAQKKTNTLTEQQQKAVWFEAAARTLGIQFDGGSEFDRDMEEYESLKKDYDEALEQYEKMVEEREDWETEIEQVIDEIHAVTYNGE